MISKEHKGPVSQKAALTIMLFYSRIGIIIYQIWNIMFNLKTKLTDLPYYTKQNLSLALGKNPDALDYWIKKLIKNQALIPLKKGLYVSSYYLDLIKAKGKTEDYLEYLAGVVRSPSYLSLEYALSKYGLIPEAVFAITSITTKSTRSYQTALTSFYYRNLKTELFSGFIEKKLEKQTIKMALPAKALFDYLYLKKFSSPAEMKSYLLSEGRINWTVFENNDRKEFTQYTKLSASKKMLAIDKILKINKLL